MSRTLRHAFTGLTLSASAIVVLAVLGQPIAGSHLSDARAHALSALEHSPLAGQLLAASGSEPRTDAECETQVAAKEAVSSAASAALARSALRMRWLLTSPSASSRSCSSPGCTG